MADSERWMLTGFEAGYRHFDTAYIYGKHFERSFTESLSRLGLDYVDLYIMHWPQTLEYSGGYDLPSTVDKILGGFKVLETPTFNDTWAEFERLHASGRARAIGVSNFSIKTLEQLFKTAKIVPAVNQVEMHPYLVDTELLEYCRKKGIVVTAYSPTGFQKLREDLTIVGLAEKYKVTPTQIILAWHLARGVVAVPKSSNAGRQKENLTLPTLTYSNSVFPDVASVTALDRNERCKAWGKFGEDGKFMGWTAEQYGW
ncbi:NADP-dependent oxidoreductase domain-containing protein [Mycena capillaripes]|nr:NADP-dependent oxidoreductase domain-containing protein [Mycena capillaripes]